MLNYWIPGIGNNKIIYSLNKFFKSLYFIILVTILMLISYFFGLEIVIYYVYTILGITIMLLCDDMFPTIPMICTGYMTVSKSQSPIQNKQSVLTSKTFLINMIIIGIVLLIGLVLRLIMDLKYRKINRKPQLLVGFILLTASMMLGGIFTKDYSLRTVLYGLLVGVTLCICYFYLFYTVNWEKIRLDYLAYMFMFIGIGVGIETIHSYVMHDWGISEFHRSEIYTGWGVYNNVGGVICTCLGLTYYLAATKKNGWIYNIIAGIIMLFVILTQSRNSIIFGLLLSFLGTLLTIIFSIEKERLFNLLVTLVFIVGTAALILSSKELLLGIFGDLADKGLNDSGRFSIYKNGLEAFKVSPIVGNGFYDFDHAPILYFEETSFLAPRYHNTVIQFLASTGIIGLLCYGYHRIQTIILLFKKISVVKIFITVSILAILFNSLLDCQLFNFGPGLHYGVLLVAFECLPHKKIIFRKEDELYE